MRERGEEQGGRGGEWSTWKCYFSPTFPLALLPPSLYRLLSDYLTTVRLLIHETSKFEIALPDF